jgi:hypothetical protein
MHFFVALLIAGMMIFGIVSAIREISVYRQALKGELQYLVSRKRLTRRLLVSFLLLLEATFLLLGFFLLSFENPLQNLLFWIPPLVLILVIVFLGILDFRETSRDLNRIMREAASETLKEKANGQSIQ